MNRIYYDQEEADENLARKSNQEEADAELDCKLVEQHTINEHTAAHTPWNNATSSSRNGIMYYGVNSSKNNTNVIITVNENNVASFPGNHGLTKFIVSHAQRASCGVCCRIPNENEDVHSFVCWIIMVHCPETTALCYLNNLSFSLTISWNRTNSTKWVWMWIVQ